jgi:hypothetical protein
MLEFLALTAVLFAILGVLTAIGARKEVMENWDKYRTNPMYLMTAFLYKPADDPRSRFEFANDNFREVMSSYSKDTLKSTMIPVSSMLDVIGSSMGRSKHGMDTVDNILYTMMGSLDGIMNVFEKRYASVLHRLKMTFTRLFNAMNRTWAIALNSVWQSIATIQAILSTVDLIIKIVIIILVILMAIIIFLFLFLWPVIPVILTVIGIIVSAGMGAAVGGMGAAFCFAEDTLVEMNNGPPKPIAEIKLGDVLGGGAITTAVMEFQYETAEMYDLHGVQVSGSHIVYGSSSGNGDDPVFVRDHPDAIRNFRWYEKPIKLYCLNTTTHRIPVIGLKTGPSGHIVRNHIVFSDWEEIAADEEAAQLKWNRHVFETLNPGAEWNAATAEVRSEAVLHPATLVRTASRGNLEISNIRPGMEVFDADGNITRVVGVVRTAWNQVKSTGGPGGTISGAAWTRNGMRGAAWKQEATHQSPPATKAPWYSLFTEAGSYLLTSGVGVRDFSDVGLEHISETYSWVLDILKNTGLYRNVC